jgi:AraC-like DNA-binding protein
MAVAGTRARILAHGLTVTKPFMQSLGLDYKAATQAVGIDAAVADDPEAYIPLRSVMLLLHNAARDCGNDAFGVLHGLRFPVGTSGALDYAVANAPTLRAALNDYVRFQALLASGYEVRFVEGKTTSHMILDVPAALGPRTQFVDMSMSIRVCRIRHIVGDPALAMRIDLQRGVPNRIGDFRRVFGRNVRFRQPRNRIGIATSLLARHLPAADPRLYRFVVRAAECALAARPRKNDVVGQLTSHLSEALTHGEVSLEAAAGAVGLTPHALRQQLRRAETTYRGVVEATRKAMADHYLSDTQLPLTEVAFLLGFSELSAFSRAARNWFGMAPRKARAHLRARPSR